MQCRLRPAETLALARWTPGKTVSMAKKRKSAASDRLLPRLMPAPCQILEGVSHRLPVREPVERAWVGRVLQYEAQNMRGAWR